MSWRSTHPGPPLDEPTGRDGDPDWYTRRWEVGLYVVAGITYVIVGMFNKWMLNWVLGPIWLIVWVWIVPGIADRIVQRVRR